MEWRDFVSQERNSPEAMEQYTGVKAELVRGAARLYATGGNAAIYYGLGVTEHSQGSTTVMAIANLAMATGNMSRPGVGVNPLRGQNNVQGACDMASFPHELTAYRHISDAATRAAVREGVELHARSGAGPAHPQHAGRRRRRHVQGASTSRARTSCSPTPTRITSPPASTHMECVVVQDLFLNETARYAHVFLPGCTFLEKDGTFTNAERRIQMVTKVMQPKNGYGDWEITQLIAQKLGLELELHGSGRDHGRDRAADADVHGRLVREDPQAGLHPVAVQRGAPRGHADHARRRRSSAARASS